MLKILIADDEAPARKRLRALIDELGEPYRVVAEAEDGNQALQLTQNEEVDLLLLDIRMPVRDGLAVAEVLATRQQPPAVIFVTAYDEHALEAFERQAIDYLLKPIRKERLVRALAKSAALTRVQLQALAALQQGDQEVITASYRGGLVRVPLDDVIYLQADQKYVNAYYLDGEVLLESSLKSLEEHYPQRFLRIHRNALVACSRLRGLTKKADGRCFVQLDDTDRELEISRRHLPEVRRWLRGRE